MNAHWSDWLFWIGGWTLAGGGALLLLWAVLGDRSRGRRRCRKCWYDMGSTDAIDGVWTCPECGKRAERERLLLKSRRRWRSVQMAVVLGVVSYFVWATPRMREEGWTGTLPTTVMILGMDLLKPETPELSVFRDSRPILQGDDPRAILYRSLSKRIRNERLAEWQWELLLWQGRKASRSPEHNKWALCEALLGSKPWGYFYESDENLRELESLMHVRFLTRAAWPEGQQVWARLRAAMPGGMNRHTYSFTLTPLVDGLSEVSTTLRNPINNSWNIPLLWGFDAIGLGTPTSGVGPFRYRLVIRRLDHGDGSIVSDRVVVLPTRIDSGHPDTPTPLRTSLQDRVDPVQDRYFFKKLTGRDPGFFLELSSLPDFDTESVAFAGIGEVLQGNAVVHRFEFFSDMFIEQSGGGWRFFSIEATPRLPSSVDRQDLTVRLVGDPIVAMRKLDATHYWAGEISVPVESSQ